MKSTLHHLAIAAVLFAGCASPAEERLAWLKAHAHPLATIQPEEKEDLSELEPLAEMIGDARIVFLGEPGHDDGGALAANTRVVKFLHERLHFDVLAIESDLYGCFKTQEKLRDKQIGPETFGLCAFAFWSRSRAMQPLWAYLYDAAHSSHPIELLGFDCQPGSKAAKQVLAIDLQRVLPSADPRAIAAVHKLINYQVRADAEEREGDRQALAELAKALASPAMQKNVPREELEMWKQLGKSLVADEEAEWLYQQNPEKSEGYYKSFNARDAQLADNLIWWTALRREHKIIVWGASAHVNRSGEGLRYHDAKAARVFVPMGELFARRYREPAPVINFLSYDGVRGRPGDAQKKKDPPAPGSIEASLVRAGIDRAFVDLREASWASQPMPGPFDKEIVPLHAFDIVVFSKTSYPNDAL